MKIAIVGSRTFDNYTLVEHTLSTYKQQIEVVVSGGARGADKLGEQWATENGIKTLIFKPDWTKYGKRAGILRNNDIIQNADYVIAFWDGQSKGTAHSISLCKTHNKPCKIVMYK